MFACACARMHVCVGGRVGSGEGEVNKQQNYWQTVIIYYPIL